MKKRILSLMLCVTMVLSMLQISVLASESTSTLDEILNSYDVTKSLDFVPGATIGGLQAGAVITDDGLNVPSEGCVLETATTLTEDGGAVELRIKAAGGMQYQINAGNNERAYGQFASGEGGCWLNKQSGVAYATADSGLFGDWADFLIVRTGSSLTVYCKQASIDGYSRLMSVENIKSGYRNGFWFKGVTDTAYIKSIKMYTAKEEETGSTLEELVGSFSPKTYDFAPGAVIDGLQAGATITEDGLLVGNNVLKYTTPLKEERNAVELRVKTAKGFLYIIDVAGGNRVYSKIAEGASGSYLNKASGAVYATAGSEMFNGWINLLIVKNGNGASIYYKKDSATKYKLFLQADSIRAGSCGGIQLVDDVGSTYVDWIKIYNAKAEENPEPSADLLTDPLIIAAERNEIWVEDDFSSNENGWSLKGFSIENGVLTGSTSDTPETKNAILNLTSYKLGENWSVSFKGKIDGGKLGGNIGYGGQRVMWAVEPTLLYLNGKFALDKPIGTGKWNEFLFTFKGTESGSLYYRSLGATKWEKALSDIAMTSYGAYEFNEAISAANTSVSLDDFKLYSGSYVKLGEPVVEADTVKVTADMNFTGDHDRRALLLCVVYDKQHGYTKEIYQKKFIVKKSESKHVEEQFNTSGINAESDAVAVMLWDDIDTVIPLVDAKGYVQPTVETDDNAETVKTDVFYNDVVISGYTGTSGNVSAALLDGEMKLKAAAQAPISDDGTVGMKLSLSPDCASGEYTLRMQYGTNLPVDQKVMLYCGDIPYASVNSEETFVEFIKTYGSDTDKANIENAAFAAGAYARYASYSSSVVDFHTFKKCIKRAMSEEENAQAVINEVNDAAKQQKWSALERLLMTTYRTYLGIDEYAAADVRNKKELYLRMTSKEYKSIDEIKEAFENAIASQLADEANAKGHGTGGGGGGSSAGGGGGSAVNVYGNKTDSETATTVPVIEEKPQFNDLTSVPWASEAIYELQRLGIVEGDGSGAFCPNRHVTREEFLKLVLMAANVDVGADAHIGFSDVDDDAWYADYVNAGYAHGIVKGISDTAFGIGDDITRADMAVIMKRVLDFCNVEVKQVKPSFVFDDFGSIPDYAMSNINALCQAELMNGVGDNRYEPLSSATRAEAATAIYRIYKYMRER